MKKETHFPDYILVRDTTLHDDMGGGGQRIYTTSGMGYEKKKYIRHDIVKELCNALDALIKDESDEEIPTQLFWNVIYALEKAKTRGG